MSLSAADGALLDAVRALRWPARRRVPASLAGEHMSRAVGRAAEFTEYRLYRQGDDPDGIDWKLLARSDRVFIRLSPELTVLPTTLLVDASASLAFPAKTHAKWHYARLIALGLAAAAHRCGDPVGIAVATDQGARQLPPRTRQGAVRDIARLLDNITPSGNPALAPLLAHRRTLSRVAIITDFLGDAGALLAAAARLSAAGREVYAVHVIHADELNPPRRDGLAMDPEHTAVRRPLTAEGLRQYDEAFRTWRAELARAWRSAGASYTQVVTAEPAAHGVRRIVTPLLQTNRR
jgi:uncharacterized protein (DUF58 family)